MLAAPSVGASKRIMAPSLGDGIILLPSGYPLYLLVASNMSSVPSFIKGNLGANNRNPPTNGFKRIGTPSFRTVTWFEAVSGNKMHQV